MKFKPGDPVWVMAKRPEFGMVGEIPAIVASIDDDSTRWSATDVFYFVELIGYPPCPAPTLWHSYGDSAGNWRSLESGMRPRRDGFDESDAMPNALGSWGNCPFKPMVTA